MAEITYCITSTETIVINDQMTTGQIAATQAKYWTAIARQSIRQRGELRLPNEAEKLRSKLNKENRFTEKAYLRFR